MRRSTEPAETPDDLPPIAMPLDVREFVINKLAEILVLDYQQAHGGPTDGEPPQQRGEP